MRWYDKQPTNWFTRWLHRRWFRAWNQHPEMGGGSRWLWLTRPLGWNQQGEYEGYAIAAVIIIPLLIMAWYTIIPYFQYIIRP